MGMIFRETELKGAFILDPERIEDERGFFARSWCREEMEARGLSADLAQCNISYNARKGTLRGMHYQLPPHAEVKLVRCTMGAIHDVIIDLRAGSPTFRRWVGVDLTADNRRMLYIPEGFAHGFQTLEDDSEVFYQISAYYHPDSARGVRWNDPAIGITWPMSPTVICARDASYGDLMT
jgi:dTDP-4-dehydrorhamnose 3,5-epimerase